MSAYAILFIQYVLHGLLIHSVCKSPSSPPLSGPPSCECPVYYTEIYEISFLLHRVWILNVKTQQQVLYQHERGSCCLKLLWLHFSGCHNCAICLYTESSSPALFTHQYWTLLHLLSRLMYTLSTETRYSCSTVTHTITPKMLSAPENLNWCETLFPTLCSPFWQKYIIKILLY